MSYKKKVLIMIAVFAALRLVYIGFGPFDLSPDEAHYWEWSRRLSLSYYSKGPAIAYVIAFFTGLFGDTAFWVRFGAVLFSTLTTYLVYLLGRDLFEDERAGFWAAFSANVAPMFAAGAVLMTTDVLLVFFWAGSVYCLKRAIDGEGMASEGGGLLRWWAGAGLLVGLGFLSKYTMALLLPSVLVFFLVSSAYRPWLLRPGPYLAAILSLFVVTPVIFWNFLHGQVTIRHTMGQVHAGSGSFSFMPLFEFLGSQAVLITPVIFAGAVYGLWKAFGKGIKESSGGLLLAFFASAPLFLFFLLKALHGKVQANWAVASYVTAFPAAAWAYYRLGERYKQRGRRVLKFVAAIGMAVAILASVLVYLPTLLEPLGAERILWGPPYNRVTGWSELGTKVSQVTEELKREAGSRSDVFIFSNTYQIASELAFYTEGNPVTYNVNTGSRRMNQYDLWPGFEGFYGYDAVYVKGDVVDVEPMVAGAFDSCTPEVFTIYRGDKILKEFSLFRCRNFKGMKGPDTEPSY